MAMLTKRLGVVAGILASLATIVGVVAVVLKPHSSDTSVEMSARDARADHGSQVFQNIHGNVSVGETAPSNPREILAHGGTQWSFSNFDEAFDNNDERTVGLFLAGGMTLRQFELENFVQRAFQPGMANQLILGVQADQPNLCPTKYELAIRFYNTARDDDQKLAFVRKLCAGPKVESAIQRSLEYAEANLTTLRQKNAASQSAINVCVEQMHRVGSSRLLSQVFGRPLLNPDFAYTDIDSVKAQLSQRLFYGATKGSWIDVAIQEGCLRMHPQAAADDSEVIQWRAILKMLRG